MEGYWNPALGVGVSLTNKPYIAHLIRVRYICLHLADFYGKRKYSIHWIVWVGEDSSILGAIFVCLPKNLAPLVSRRNYNTLGFSSPMIWHVDRHPEPPGQVSAMGNMENDKAKVWSTAIWWWCKSWKFAWFWCLEQVTAKKKNSPKWWWFTMVQSEKSQKKY